MRKRLLVVGVALLAAGARMGAQAAQPDTGGAYYQFLLGLHLEMTGDAQGAAAAYEQAEKLDPQSAEIPAALAALYARLNRGPDAIAAGERGGNGATSHPGGGWVSGRPLRAN